MTPHKRTNEQEPNGFTLPWRSHGQRICWELLRALDKVVARERDSEVVAALKRIKEDGLAKFTREPDKGKEIYDEIL